MISSLSSGFHPPAHCTHELLLSLMGLIDSELRDHLLVNGPLMLFAVSLLLSVQSCFHWLQALKVRFGERFSKLHILDSRLLPLIL